MRSVTVHPSVTPSPEVLAKAQEVVTRLETEANDKRIGLRSAELRYDMRGPCGSWYMAMEWFPMGVHAREPDVWKDEVTT